jgi:hypothetical protein
MYSNSQGASIATIDSIVEYGAGLDKRVTSTVVFPEEM